MISLYHEIETISQYYDLIPPASEHTLGKYLVEHFEKLKPHEMVRAYIAINHKTKPLTKVFFARYLWASRYVTETQHNFNKENDVVVDLAEYFKNYKPTEPSVQELLLKYVQKNGVNIVTCPECKQVVLVEIGQKTHTCEACGQSGIFKTIELK